MSRETDWHHVDRGGDDVWVARRGGAVVGVVTHLSDDTQFHPMRVREDGERYKLPPQNSLHFALRYVELVNGDYWPAPEQLRINPPVVEQLELALPSPGFMRVVDPCAGFREQLADQHDRLVDDHEGER